MIRSSSTSGGSFGTSAVPSFDLGVLDAQGCVLAGGRRGARLAARLHQLRDGRVCRARRRTSPAPAPSAGGAAGRQRHRRRQHQRAVARHRADHADHDRRAACRRRRRGGPRGGDRRRGGPGQIRASRPGSASTSGRRARTSRPGTSSCAGHPARARADRPAGRGRRPGCGSCRGRGSSSSRPATSSSRSAAPRLRPDRRLQLGHAHRRGDARSAPTPYRGWAGCPTTPGRCMETLEGQLVRADAIITTGGVSMGAFDTVKEVLSRVGTVQFDKVAMRPGMPQGFGRGRRPAGAGLHAARQPGQRARVVRRVRRAGAARHGGPARAAFPPGYVPAVAAEPCSSVAGKMESRGSSRRRPGRLAGGQGSHMLGALAAADALAVIPPR